MYRILRSIKNRFGSTSELGIYEMEQQGLREVSNPSELLLTEDHEGLSGVAISSTIEERVLSLSKRKRLCRRLLTERRNVQPQASTNVD